MASRGKLKQLPNVKKTTSPNPAREANANASIVGTDDAPDLLAATANTEASVILAAINDMGKRMEERFNNLEASLQATQATLTEHDTRISTVEAASSDHDIRLTELKQQWLQLEASHRSLQEKVIDLEAGSRRQNIKVVGLPERAEGKNSVDFFANFLCDLLGCANFPTPIEVDRAHRLGQPPDARAQPRIMIARIHSFRVKEKILRLARENTPLTYDGTRIHIYPDYPAEIMKRRQPFEEVKKKFNKECAPDSSILHGSESPKVLTSTGSSTPQKMPIASCSITVILRRGDVFAPDCLIYAGCCNLLWHRPAAVG